MLSYLVEQRTKEIGVRMALGASSQQVTQLMLSQTTRPVIYGLLAGAGLAATLATVLLATPAGAMIAEIVHVTDPVAYAASLIVIIAACLLAAWIPATRAARVDPMQTLRQDWASPAPGSLAAAATSGWKGQRGAPVAPNGKSPDYRVATATPFAAFAMRSATARGCDT